MKLNKTVLCLGMASALMAGSALADGTSTDSTTVKFHGTITEAPCSLDSSSENQTVEMGHIAAHLLENKGTSDSVPFSFKLTNCDTSNQKTVTLTFSGSTDTNDSSLLALGSGDASGAGIGISANGSAVTFGEATAAQNLSDGDNTLTFSAYLQGDGASSVTAGEFTSVSNVTFTYQ